LTSPMRSADGAAQAPSPSCGASSLRAYSGMATPNSGTGAWLNRPVTGGSAMPQRDLDYVTRKLHWMEGERIWPNGLRYLWTDAFGLVLYVSLFRETGEERWLSQAKWLVGEVDRVLGRPRGYRIGEAADRDGQYFHYLAMWLYALACLSEHEPHYCEKGIRIAKDIHRQFVLPGRGVIWKMEEDLSAPYPGYGLGAMDAFDGYVSYKLL